MYQPLPLGRSLREELAACLLGGFGMRAEVGLAAFRRLRAEGLLEGTPTAATLEGALARPFADGERIFRYRYSRQKAAYLSGCLRAIDELGDEKGDLAKDLQRLVPNGSKVIASQAGRGMLCDLPSPHVNNFS
jgi:hypothetical protein